MGLTGIAGRAIRAGGVLALAAALIVPLGAPATAEAEDLKDTVRNLYGGDGIRLRPPAAGSGAGGGGGGGGGRGTGGGRVFSHEPHFLVSSLQGLDNLGTALASNVGLFSMNSTVTGTSGG